MSGSGGGIFSGRFTAERMRSMIRESQDETRKREFTESVNLALVDILADYNNRNPEAVSAHLEEIKEIIKDEVGAPVTLRFGGSVKKHTYVDGLSDVDVLVIVDKTDLSALPPADSLKFIRSKLLNQLSDADSVRTGKMAVTIKFPDSIEIQLVPALKAGGGIRVPKPEGDAWSSVVRPDRFAEKLTEVNEACSNRVVPVIKLVKGINAQLPSTTRLRSYHVESMAIEIFESYPDTHTKAPKQMLEYFFRKAPELVRRPILDKTGQSLYVDDYLGPAQSSDRIRMSYTLDRVARKMKDAEEIGSVDDWLGLLGE